MEALCVPPVVTHDITHDKLGSGRRLTTRTETWHATRCAPFSWEDLPRNEVDTVFYKKTVWTCEDGKVFDEDLCLLEPRAKGDHQKSLCLTFAGLT